MVNNNPYYLLAKRFEGDVNIAFTGILSILSFVRVNYISGSLILLIQAAKQLSILGTTKHLFATHSGKFHFERLVESRTPFEA